MLYEEFGEDFPHQILDDIVELKGQRVKLMDDLQKHNNLIKTELGIAQEAACSRIKNLVDIAIKAITSPREDDPSSPVFQSVEGARESKKIQAEALQEAKELLSSGERSRIRNEINNVGSLIDEPVIFSV